MKKHLILIAIILFLLTMIPVSAEETKDICKLGTNLVECIKSQYIEQGSNGLYHHDETLENGANDGSYRYAGGDYKVSEKYKNQYLHINDIIKLTNEGYGKNYLVYDSENKYYSSFRVAVDKAISDGYVELNNLKNWICFGSKDEVCDDEHLYRIIGVFDNKNDETGIVEKKVKLIKAYDGTEESLGTASIGGSFTGNDDSYYKGKLSSNTGYTWSGKYHNYDPISWSTSTTNTGILNGTYLKKLGDYWTDKIDLSEWSIGGNSGNNIVSKNAATAYQNEVMNPVADSQGNKTYNAKIGLMYVSDYGFAASPENWIVNLGKYNSDDNRYNNWLFLGINEYTILRNSGSTGFYFFVGWTGALDDALGGPSVVRPTFYLKSDIAYVSGEGTEINPIRIASVDELPKEDPKPEEKPDDKDIIEAKPEENNKPPKDEFENPATGFFIPLAILTIGLIIGIVIIIKTIKNKRLFKL